MALSFVITDFQVKKLVSPPCLGMFTSSPLKRRAPHILDCYPADVVNVLPHGLWPGRCVCDSRVIDCDSVDFNINQTLERENDYLGA